MMYTSSSIFLMDVCLHQAAVYKIFYGAGCQKVRHLEDTVLLYLETSISAINALKQRTVNCVLKEGMILCIPVLAVVKS